MFSLFLIGCSKNNIDLEDPEDTAKFFQKSLYPDEELIFNKTEFSDGVQDVYEFNETNWLIATHDKKVQQINFTNLDANEVEPILDLINFPDTHSITSLLNESSEGNDNESADIKVFTKYEGVGVQLSMKSEFSKEIMGDKPFSMIIIYDEETLEKFSERN